MGVTTGAASYFISFGLYIDQFTGFPRVCNSPTLYDFVAIVYLGPRGLAATDLHRFYICL